MIAEKIVEKHPEEVFHAIIYRGEHLTDKYRYYAERLMSRCATGEYLYDYFLYTDHTPQAYVYNTFKLRISHFFRYWAYSKLYLGFYRAIPLLLLVDALPFIKEIYTFDDGFLNLSHKTFYLDHRDYPRRKLDKYVNIAHPFKILSVLSGHYTIYDGANAAHPRPEKIELFSLSKEADTLPSVSDEEVIFLGQPIFETEKNRGGEKNKEVSEALVQELNCSFYIPHPREYYKVDGVEYIETPLIAEDYLLQELEKHPKRCYTVYSYFSTTLVNLKDHPRIKMVSCRPASVPEKWHESYELLERMGIEIREFPNI